MAISFQTVLLKCAEMTGAFTDGVCALSCEATCTVSTVQLLFIIVHVSVRLWASGRCTYRYVCVLMLKEKHSSREWVGVSLPAE